VDAFLNIKTFVLVARYQSFTHAARQLDVVPSVVAKRIGQLEKALGTRLFERTTRSVKLTEAGEKLFARAGELVNSFDDLLHSVDRDESKLAGHIRIAVPTTLTLSYLGGVFTDFLAGQDRITMDVVLQDDSVNPAERGFDIAISGRSASYEGVVEIPLCPTRLAACAAPAYLARKGAPATPAELPGHDCLVFRPSGLNWQFNGPRGVVQIEVAPRLVADDNITLLRAGLAGLGIVVLPRYIVRTALEQGGLTRILDGYEPSETWFTMYVPRRKRSIARIEALVDFVSARMSSDNWIDSVRLPL
jgi:DNA-binding transcriptional LysR family regulator